jgi:hypothetical protein
VKRLSKSVTVRLKDHVGEWLDEDDLLSMLLERRSVLLRLLHAKKSSLQEGVLEKLSCLKLGSYQALAIEAEIQIGRTVQHVPCNGLQAIYEENLDRLVICKAAGNNWAIMLKALIHPLLSSEPMSEVLPVIAQMKTFMRMSEIEAHRDMDETGIPRLEDGLESPGSGDLDSADAGSIGIGTDQATPTLEARSSVGTGGTVAERGSPKVSETKHPRTGDGRSPVGVRDDRRVRTRTYLGKAVPTTNDHSDGTQGSSIGGLQAGIAAGANGSNTKVSASSQDNDGRGTSTSDSEREKRQRDKHLLSYVRSARQATPDSDGAERLRRNLDVEEVARAVVCEYEELRGRVPTHMPPTHPGFDIMSRDAITGEVRHIEVKALSDAWNDVGVGLSAYQYGTAASSVVPYWLYVVEYSTDPTKTKVYAIPNPVRQVDRFMFDANWRDFVEDEMPKKGAGFIPGVRVRHRGWGVGTIEKVVESNPVKRVLSIDFGERGIRTVTVNEAMTILDE